ncbi:hypothetical protein ACHAXT_000989 [Thalassiosira profunda]
MSLFSRLSQAQRPPDRPGDEGGEGPGGDAGAGGENGDSLHFVAPSTLNDISAKAGVLLKTRKPGDITNFPKKGDTVTIHYEAFTEEEICNAKRSGEAPDPFDSSRARGQQFQFRIGAGQVIEGMDVAVSKMSLGQEVEATIPYPFAYGVQGYPPVVPPRATLIFRIELIRFASVV